MTAAPAPTVPASEGPTQPPALPETGWTAAVARVRDTNAWIVKAFVALAGVLIGSGPLLVKLGDLPSLPLVLLAAVMGLTALVGVGVVIHYASTVMLPETTDLTDLVTATSGPLAALRNHVESYPATYLGDARSVAALLADLDGWERTSEQLSERAATGTSRSSTERAALERARAAARAQLDALRARFADLLDQAVYAEVRATFERARRFMYAGALLTAVGTAVYLGALGVDLGNEDEKGTDSPTVATVGTFTWLSGADEVRRTLGLSDSTCTALPVSFTGSGTAESPWQLTTLPVGDCSRPAMSFTVDDRYGVLHSDKPTPYELTTRIERRTRPEEVMAAATAALLAGVAGTAFALRQRKS